MFCPRLDAQPAVEPERPLNGIPLAVTQIRRADERGNYE